MLSEEQLAEWERLANAATEGPWTHPGRTFVVSKSQKDEPVVADCNFSEIGQGPRNAKFIAITREAVPALIAEVRRTVALWRFTSAELREKTEQLEKEANWLANKLALSVNGSCPRDNTPDYPCNSADNVPHDCAKCWREAARKAVEDASNNS